MDISFNFFSQINNNINFNNYFQEVTSTDLKTLENAIENLSSEQKKLIVEKEEIQELKEELKDYQEVNKVY